VKGKLIKIYLKDIYWERFK